MNRTEWIEKYPHSVVIGYIDGYGHIHGEVIHDRFKCTKMHPEEWKTAGKCWRFYVSGQDFCWHTMARGITHNDFCVIGEWINKKGLIDKETLADLYDTARRFEERNSD
jgi:hypothetical protein